MPSNDNIQNKSEMLKARSFRSTSNRENSTQIQKIIPTNAANLNTQDPPSTSINPQYGKANLLNIKKKKKEQTLEQIKQGNPQYVTTYSKEIMDYLLNKEQKSSFENYFKNQTSITEKMREIVIDWLVDVSVKFKLLSSTLFMAVNIIDRYLQKEVIMKDMFQCVAITA